MSNDQKKTKKLKVESVDIVDKLTKERNKLKNKIDKLDKWLQTDEPYVSTKNYMLLLSQYNIMQAYRIILDIRIEDLKKPRSVFSGDCDKK